MRSDHDFLLRQRETIEVLRKALNQIESEDATSVTFACENGTHRSVGSVDCACSLAMFFYVIFL